MRMETAIECGCVIVEFNVIVSIQRKVDLIRVEAQASLKEQYSQHKLTVKTPSILSHTWSQGYRRIAFSQFTRKCPGLTLLPATTVLAL